MVFAFCSDSPRRKVCILLVSCRSAMNFVKMLFWSALRRNSGRLWRSAVATTSSEGGNAGTNGAQPGTEGAPDELREGDGEVLKQSLADEPCLDEDVVGVELALDVVAVFERGAMEMLIAVIAAQWLHVGHPEMIAERADLAHSLLEGELDLEAQTIETNDLDGLQGGVGAHQQASASCGMDHGDEAHQAACGTP